MIDERGVPLTAEGRERARRLLAEADARYTPAERERMRQGFLARLDAMAGVTELKPDEQRELLEREAQRLLGMSAEEFARRWHAGEFSANEDPKITGVAMLLPDAW